MKLSDLQKAVESHEGKFHCAKINDESVTKTVSFQHKSDSPVHVRNDIPIEKLKEFYETFGSLVLYHDGLSNDAAFYIASPDVWSSLDDDFRPWLEDLDEEEEEDLLPTWINDCIVFGEIPSSGNYLLMPLSGEKQGYVFEFEHDGFDFIECAQDIEQFVYKLLDPNTSILSNMASHMRFIENEDYLSQWWIVELQDNRGNKVRTKE